MAFKPFKFLGKLASKLIPGGVVSQIIGLDKTPEQVKAGLELLTPIAQYNLTMARPRIMIAIVYTYLGGIIIRWIQILCHVDKTYLIDMPKQLVEFAVVIVGIIAGTRGFEKIVKGIFNKKVKE